MCQSVAVPQAVCRYRRMKSAGFDLTTLPSCYASAAHNSYPSQLWKTCCVWSFCAFNQAIYIGRHCLTRSVHQSSNPGAKSRPWTRCPRAPAMASSALKPGSLLPILKPDQGDAPNVRGTGQRLLGQPGGLPEPADPLPQRPSPLDGYRLDGRPVGLVAVVAGEVPRNINPPRRRL